MMAMKGSESAKVAAQLPLRSVRTEVAGMGFFEQKYTARVVNVN
jgi:hypothetical protein